MARPERGAYRALYASFWDDPDVHTLSDRAYRVLTTLKGALPLTGIGVVYELQMRERCGSCSREELEAAYQELEAPKPGGELGWIVRERNLVWVVNGLRFEPALSSRNTTRHGPFVRSLVSKLGDDRAIVGQFRAYYPEWFDAPASPPLDPSRDTLSQPYRKGSDRASIQERRETGDGRRETRGRAVDGDGDLLPRARGPALVDDRPSPSPVLASHDATVAIAQLLSRFYPPDTATPRRRADVERELLSTLDPKARGQPYKGQQVKARSPRHLAAAIAHVLSSPPPRKSDAAITWVLRKLADPWVDTDERGRTVTEAAAAAAKRDSAELDREHEQLRRQAAAWGLEHPSEYAALTRQAEAEYPGTSAVVHHAREAWLMTQVHRRILGPVHRDRRPAGVGA